MAMLDRARHLMGRLPKSEQQPDRTAEQQKPRFPNTSIAKLTIGSLDDVNLTVFAQYNPREIAQKRSYKWDDQKPVDKQLISGELSYGGVQAGTMSVELLFDGVETDGIVDKKPIGQVVEDLKCMGRSRNPRSTLDDERRPHHCIVAWGFNRGRANEAIPSFPCVIESIDVKYQVFSPTGKVLRATVTVGLKECLSATRGSSLDDAVTDAQRKWEAKNRYSGDVHYNPRYPAPPRR